MLQWLSAGIIYILSPGPSHCQLHCLHWSEPCCLPPLSFHLWTGGKMIPPLLHCRDADTHIQHTVTIQLVQRPGWHTQMLQCTHFFRPACKLMSCCPGLCMTRTHTHTNAHKSLKNVSVCKCVWIQGVSRRGAGKLQATCRSLVMQPARLK